jgi:hypothetical protein
MWTLGFSFLLPIYPPSVSLSLSDIDASTSSKRNNGQKDLCRKYYVRQIFEVYKDKNLR